MSERETKTCPSCHEEILAVAKKCRYCGAYMVGEILQPSESSGLERMLVPVGRPVSAIAAGYCALFGILPVFGLPFSVAAIICGITALKSIRNKPGLSGSGRAWFGIIAGSLGTLFSLFVLICIAIAFLSQPPR